MNSINSSSTGVIAWYSTADVAISSSIASILRTVLPSTALNALPLPGQLLNLGMSSTADTVSYMGRFALFQNETAGLEYLNSPPGYVLLATPSFIPAAALFPYPSFRPYANLTNENYLNQSLNNLKAAVISTYANIPYNVSNATDAEALINYQNGFSCINLTLNCNGDNRDARYFGVSDIILGNSSNDFLYVIGVIHNTTGKATYSNVAFYNQNQSLGVVAVADDNLRNTSLRFIPDDPNNIHVYAIKAARTCATNETNCVTIPVTFPGVPLDAPINIIERVYVEPSSNVAPLAGTCLLPIVIHFKG